MACRTLSRLLIAAALLAVTATAADAQRGFRYGRGRGVVVRGIPDGSEGFMFCRLWFEAVRSDPSGTGWEIEYPRADQNFMTRLSQLTTTKIANWANGMPGHTVVRATDPELLRCPFVMMSSPGTAGFEEEEVVGLREYLLKGGFLWGDDFWGDDSFDHWEMQVRRILPDYPIQEIPIDHPLFDSFYRLKEVPQIPSLNRWRPGMSTSERPGAQYQRASMHGVFDETGRLLILMTHNTDIADGWEREQDMESFFVAFAWKSYSVGVNVAIWSMTH